jgi:hypothetical protein
MISCRLTVNGLFSRSVAIFGQNRAEAMEPLYLRGFGWVNILCVLHGGRERPVAGKFLPVNWGKREKFMPDFPAQDLFQRGDWCAAPTSGATTASRDKKTGLSGQRMTKKPGEFSNLVHL